LPERREAEFAFAPESVRQARQFVVAALAAWGLGELAGTAELLTSEVTTNAVAHARTPYRLAIERRARDVLVEVSDGSARLPERRCPGIDDPSGRGLLIVNCFAGAWGSYRRGDGKVVWFILSPAQSGGRSPRCSQATEVAATDGDPAGTLASGTQARSRRQLRV
jgi:hypothetical protein